MHIQFRDAGSQGHDTDVSSNMRVDRKQTCILQAAQLKARGRTEANKKLEYSPCRGDESVLVEM